MTIGGGSIIDLSNVPDPKYANACVFMQGDSNMKVALESVTMDQGGAWYCLRNEVGKLSVTDETWWPNRPAFDAGDLHGTGVLYPAAVEAL